MKEFKEQQEGKHEIRRQMKARRVGLSQPEKHRMDQAIRFQLLSLVEFWRRERRKASAPAVFVYASFGGEVDTYAFMEELWLRGFLVAAPRILNGEIRFYQVEGKADLEKGSRGILEPKPGCAEIDIPDAAVIVPGTAFTRAGGRLGYGGGFYDRFFEANPSHLKIAAAYPFQVVEQLPLEAHDCPVDLIVTGDEMIVTKNCATERTRWIEMVLEELGRRAKEAAVCLSSLGVTKKNEGLKKAAQALLDGESDILAANVRDLSRAEKNGMSQALLDRLRLTPQRIKSMADGLLEVAALEDPVGEVLSMKLRPNGLLIGKKRVPLGVAGIIYEARPNVTADAFGLCFKTGNAVILKGGSDAIDSNCSIVRWLKKGLADAGINEDALQLITYTDRETTREFMRLSRYVDVLIPRGGTGLIRTVVENSTIPVIETGTGNCHIYVDESADFDMALGIILNAKTQRIGVCNACESLVVHKDIADRFLPVLWERLKEKKVEVRADQRACLAVPEFSLASEEDWGAEYLDYILSLKIVDSLDEAIQHINRYNTGHSEAIITRNYDHAQKFLDKIDAAAVYVNASTRFTDGNEFGFGAEIGISTQKLHARGPMGLEALTTTKYIIYGSGQVRQ